MLAADPDIALSISAPTRPMRPGEPDGVDYHFVAVDRFKTMAADGEFLEWAHVFGPRYGTPRDRVAVLLAAGKGVRFDKIERSSCRKQLCVYVYNKVVADARKK